MKETICTSSSHQSCKKPTWRSLKIHHSVPVVLWWTSNWKEDHAFFRHPRFAALPILRLGSHCGQWDHEGAGEKIDELNMTVIEYELLVITEHPGLEMSAILWVGWLYINVHEHTSPSHILSQMLLLCSTGSGCFFKRKHTLTVVEKLIALLVWGQWQSKKERFPHRNLKFFEPSWLGLIYALYFIILGLIYGCLGKNPQSPWWC